MYFFYKKQKIVAQISINKGPHLQKVVCLWLACATDETKLWLSSLSSSSMYFTFCIHANISGGHFTFRLRAVSLFSWSVEQNARDTQMTRRVTEGARRERHDKRETTRKARENSPGNGLSRSSDFLEWKLWCWQTRHVLEWTTEVFLHFFF